MDVLWTTSVSKTCNDHKKSGDSISTQNNDSVSLPVNETLLKKKDSKKLPLSREN